MNNINKIYIILSTVENSDKWYNSNIVSAIIGALSAIFGTFIAIYFSEKNRKKDDRKNIIMLIIQSNPDLFNLIFNSAKNKININHTEFRKLLKQSNIVYLLPGELKIEFLKLLKIYELKEEDFKNEKSKVYIQCKKIVDTIERYGAGIFE